MVISFDLYIYIYIYIYNYVSREVVLEAGCFFDYCYLIILKLLLYLLLSFLLLLLLPFLLSLLQCAYLYIYLQGYV